MRVALAGLGSAARRAHLTALAALGPEASVVAAADPDAGQREAAAAMLPSSTVFASADELLSSTDCDVLVVATTPDTHAQLVTLGLERGLHVLCEKPLTVDRAGHAAIARACARRPDLAVVPVHQYRYSPQWRATRRWARLANALCLPFSLTFVVERPSADRHAMSPWRADIARFGGMLADTGVHFLALAWTIDHQLDLVAAVRVLDERGERSTAIYRVGSGVMTIEVVNGAPVRQNRSSFHVGPAVLGWTDDVARLRVDGRTLWQRRVPALVDRTHVDALYLPLYRDLARNLNRPAWRAHRTAEALAVGDAIVELLERTPLERSWTPSIS